MNQESQQWFFDKSTSLTMKIGYTSTIPYISDGYLVDFQT